MADEATDVQQAEISLDEFMSDEQESPKAESSTAEDKKPEVAPEEAKAPEAKEEAEKEGEPEVKEEAEKPAKPLEPLGKAEQRKDQLLGEIQTYKDKLGISPNAEIRDLVAARNALKARVEKTNAEVYEPATEEDLTAQGMNSLEAKVEAMRQQNEMREYNERVVEAQLTINTEAERVIRDFPIFNPESDVFDKELADEAAALLEANLIRDPNTNEIIGSNVSPYQLYKTLDRASGISATKGQIKAQQATEKMLANADSASSAAPAKKTEDPLVELWKSDD